jgi:hypothetical protein
MATNFTGVPGSTVPLKETIDGFPDSLVDFERRLIATIDADEVIEVTDSRPTTLRCTLFLFQDKLLIAKRPSGDKQGKVHAGVDDLDVTKLDLYLDDVWVAKAGGRNPDYQEADGQRVMKQAEITVRVKLARGDASATVWTCDLSHDYVSINADYRS